ncbi:hypothetical protein RchiOBHm_Chr7g0231651 [Rosa chinensis]|uniref:Uncharacterized protein n=1 Tax=Rosa chinensis TaxID=74649 RepID=A0A2P6PFQ6_ROSCH|nr:hypothetical protein RchiOBHm_Chr7g0231651 [Rosa chinensis]
MFSGGGSCVSNHLRLRDSDLHRCHQPQLGFGFVFGFGLGTQITGLRVRRSLKSLSARRISSFRSIIHSKSPPDIPTLSHCFRYGSNIRHRIVEDKLMRQQAQLLLDEAAS